MIKQILVVMAAICMLSAYAFGGELEVLHWWTSGGEAKSVAVLKKQLENEGHTWKDFAVAGGGGDAAMTVLKSRALAGALNSATMVKALEILKMIKSYTDKGAPGRDWNLATAMVIQGKAAMQFMGDWAKGEFTTAGKLPGADYGDCI